MPRPLVLAFGDSLTAGYGLPAADALPRQLETLLRERFPTAAVQNAGVSGDTTASALARLPRVLASLNAKPDLAIVELGANDLMRGVALERSRANLDAILATLTDCGIAVLLTAMEAPRFLGVFGDRCDALYAALALKHGTSLCPFFPPGVLGHPALTLRDRLHPNAEAVRRVARHLQPHILKALDHKRASAA